MSIRHEREARLANGFEDQRGYALGGVVVSKEAAERAHELLAARLEQQRNACRDDEDEEG